MRSIPKIQGFNKQWQEAANQEIRRQLEYHAENSALCFDACVLLALNQAEGWGKRRLRKFWEAYEKVERDMMEYFQTAPMSTASGRFDSEFYAVETLKRIGVDVPHWRKVKGNWTPENDQCWKEHN